MEFTPYGTDPRKDERVDSVYAGNRIQMAIQGYGLDKLVNDEDRDVREEVARQGYGLDILVNDSDDYVRVIAEEMLEKQKKNSDNEKSVVEQDNENDEIDDR